MESHFIPKEETGLASVFLYRLNGKQQGFFLFFLVSSAFTVSLILAGCVGHRGGPLSEAGAIGPSGLSVGWKLPQFHVVSLIKSKEYVPAEKTGLLVWPCREGCIVLFGPVPATICQHSCLVTCSLLFLLFTQDECDTGGFLQSRR